MLVIQQDFLNKGQGKGFQMTFENGNTISVMFGIGNYCGNPTNEQGRTANKLAEVAIWNDKQQFYQFEGRDVIGWQTANEVADLIYLAANTIF